MRTEYWRAKALCSALSANGLKVTIDKATVRVWEDKQRTTLPGDLKDKACNAIIQWTGSGKPRTNGDVA